MLERAGRPLGLGIVLDGDGRIMTALSTLTHGNFVTARYHDGSQSPVKLAHSDRAWDLALLTPAKSDKKQGLRATKAVGLVGLQLLTLAAQPNTVAAAPAALKLATPLLGGDGRTLQDAFELGMRPAYAGAPIVNAEGDVVALVARACPSGSGAGCVPAPYGVPVSALKQFLRKVPAEASWLGIQVAAHEQDGVRGLRVVSLVSGPAAAAGVRSGKDAGSGDLIVAVDGTPVTSPAELTDAIRAHAVGDNVELLLYGMRRYRQVSLIPRPAPELTAPPSKPVQPKTPNPYR